VDSASLIARYQRVRRPRPISGEPHRVFVLSRVTLGADVAVTKRAAGGGQSGASRTPKFVFVGPAPSNFDLFAGRPAPPSRGHGYRRGGLPSGWRSGPVESPAGRAGFGGDRPDSRLTQLGPCRFARRTPTTCSIAAGMAADRPRAAELAAAWAEEMLGVSGAKPYVALERESPALHGRQPGSRRNPASGFRTLRRAPPGSPGGWRRRRSS